MSSPIKSSKEDYVSSKPLKRLSLLKWWFWVLIVIGLIAIAFAFFMQGDKLIQSLDKVSSLSFGVIATAYAQPVAEVVKETPIRVFVISGVFIILGVVYLAAIFKVLFSGNADNIETASDLVKTLTGFFVGVGTSMFQ